MHGGLWAQETLKGAFEMMTKGPDTFKIWVGFQKWDVHPKEGGNFIISDGCIHFESCGGWSCGYRSITKGASGIIP
jgi:hypothetical protein